jgi:cytochrome c peroxidase
VSVRGEFNIRATKAQRVDGNIVAFFAVTGLVLAILLLPATRPRAAKITFPLPLPKMASQPPEVVELGRMLFFDRRLSGDGTMSCASCHIPEEGYGDGQPLSGAYPTNKHWRHTQTLINVAYLESFFWDGRSRSLEDQARGPIHTSFEMNLNLDYLVARLREIPTYAATFRKAFGGEMTTEQILKALVAFERTLVVDDTPFDRYLAGDPEALNPEALKGAEIFFGERGGCGVCHAGALLTDEKFHNIGVADTSDLRKDPQRRATRNFFLGQMGLSPMERDPGRYAVSRKQRDMGAFRTPPLRQVAQTAPYMHNGSLGSLEAVVEFFSHGGGEDPNKSPLLQKRSFSEEEKSALLSFLHSLSGTVPEAKPPVLPDF